MKCNFKFLIITFSLLISIGTLRAQSLTVTGKVIDHEGLEVIGGTVTIKGVSGTGTVTNIDGQYTIQVNDASKDVLVFSYIGL